MSDDPWDHLRAVPRRMADAVRPLLASVTIEGYQRFLDHMFHYTHGSGERLRWAADRAPAGPCRDLFAELAKDEQSHYRLAELDLAAFGRAPSPEPPPSVIAFDRAWRGHEPAGWLGALYALESVAEHLADDARRNLGRLGLGRDQARFVLVHLDADVGHAAATAEQLAGALREAPAVTRAAADQAAAFWVELHRDALG